MFCTFGDMLDVQWWKNLPLIEVLGTPKLCNQDSLMCKIRKIGLFDVQNTENCEEDQPNTDRGGLSKVPDAHY